MNDIENKTLSSRIGALIVKYRILIFGFLALLIIAAGGTAVIMAVNSISIKKNLAAIDSLSFRLAKNKEAESPDVEQKTEILNEARALSEKHSGVVGVRAAMLAADIEFEQKNWENSCTLWIRAAKADEKAYTASICWYNAAVCCEELGDNAKALEYFDTAAALKNFPLASRALFNCGRIAEHIENYAGAAEHYKKLNDSFPDSEWAKLAKSRMIALKTQGRIP